MNRLIKIITEELIKFLNENYDSLYDFYERKSEIESDMFNDFIYNNNSDFTKNMPWNVINFNKLKKIWEDFMQYGFVRDVKGLEDIKKIMIDNTIKINILTEIAGHTQYDMDEIFNDNTEYWLEKELDCIFSSSNNKSCINEVHPFVKLLYEQHKDEELTRDELYKIVYDEIKEKFYFYYMDDPEHKMGGYISDYGLEPLNKLLDELLRNTKPEQDVVTIDKMLNVVHQRSDIASWFLEGGSRSLEKLSGEISET